MYFPPDRTAHITAFDGLVMDHWSECKIAQTANGSVMQDRSVMQEDSNLYSRVFYHLSYVPPRYHSAGGLLSHSDSTISHHECGLSQVYTHPNMTLHVAMTYNNNQPDIAAKFRIPDLQKCETGTLLIWLS